MITTPETQHKPADKALNHPQAQAQRIEWFDIVAYLMQYQINIKHNQEG